MNYSERKLSNALFIIIGLLFVFSMLSIAFSFNSLLKDIVYTAGLLIGITLIIYYKKRSNNK